MSNILTGIRRHPSIGVVSVLLCVFGVLEALTRLHMVSPVILVPPDEMFAAVGDIVMSGQLFPNLWRTLLEVLISVGSAIVIGIPIGLIFWHISFLERILEPYLVGLYAMPLILFYPFALVIFGLGSVPVIVIAATMGLVPVVLNSAAAFKQIPDIYFRVSRVFACRGVTRFYRISLPAAAPLLFAGLKLSLIYSFIGVIVMEFMTGSTGLGFQVANNYASFKIQDMYAYVIVIIVLAALIVTLLTAGEKSVRRESGA